MNNSQLKLNLEFDEDNEDNMKVIGYISVDSGTIRIADPCIEYDFDPNVITANLDEDGVIENLHDVIVMTPYGDGRYPVYLDKEDPRKPILIIPLESPYNCLFEEEVAS